MQLTRFACLILAVLMVLAHAGRAAPEPASAAEANYRLQTSTLGAAGAPGMSTGFRTKGTLAQPTPTGVGSAGGKTVYAGFWSRPWLLAAVFGEEQPVAPVDHLYQNFPNPFTARTTIAFSVASQAHVRLDIFNIRGQKIASLATGVHTPGRHLIEWDGRDQQGHRVSPGVYLCRFETTSYASVKKLLVLE
jgi:hypothetical protein